jgi:hypothetical protein
MWVHTCNVTTYRNTVSWQCGRDSWPRTYKKLVTRQRHGLVRCAVGIWTSHQRVDKVKAWTGLDVQRDTSQPSTPLPFFSFLMLLSWSVVRICGVVRFLERFGNCEMEWTEESVIEFIKTQRQCESFLNRNGFPELCVLFRDFFSNQIN